MTVEPSDDEEISVSHDPETDTYRATFDSATTEPTVAVVQAMAAAEETDPTDLDPLYEAVDPRGSTGSAARTFRRAATATVPSSSLTRVAG